MIDIEPREFKILGLKVNPNMPVVVAFQHSGLPPEICEVAVTKAQVIGVGADGIETLNGSRRILDWNELETLESFDDPNYWDVMACNVAQVDEMFNNLKTVEEDKGERVSKRIRGRLNFNKRFKDELQVLKGGVQDYY